MCNHLKFTYIFYKVNLLLLSGLCNDIQGYILDILKMLINNIQNIKSTIISFKYDLSVIHIPIVILCLYHSNNNYIFFN